MLLVAVLADPTTVGATGAWGPCPHENGGVGALPPRKTGVCGLPPAGSEGRSPGTVVPPAGSKGRAPGTVET
eukprot:scaffold91_cov127-Cylindrotheca_fusiformis.AAC.35